MTIHLGVHATVHMELVRINRRKLVTFLEANAQFA
jgi:hypothetical protein